MYQERKYREWSNSNDLILSNVKDFESDLYILSESNVEEIAIKEVRRIRNIIFKYGEENIDFFKSRIPLKVKDHDPKIIKHMKESSKKANVGPMASVAGAVNFYLSKKLENICKTLIIENGGDLYIKSNKERIINIYAGESIFKDKIKIIEKGEIGICTSSGIMGHSLSFGKADAVVVKDKDTLVADSFATSIGNMIKTKEDIEKGLKFAKKNNLEGVIIIAFNKIGIWGNIKLVK